MVEWRRSPSEDRHHAVSAEIVHLQQGIAERHQELGSASHTFWNTVSLEVAMLPLCSHLSTSRMMFWHTCFAEPLNALDYFALLPLPIKLWMLWYGLKCLSHILWFTTMVNPVCSLNVVDRATIVLEMFLSCGKLAFVMGNHTSFADMFRCCQFL